MIQQKKWYFNSETVITAQNVQKIAELITVGAVKNVMIHSSRDLYRLYKGLLADINRPQDSFELLFRRLRLRAGSDLFFMQLSRQENRRFMHGQIR